MASRRKQLADGLQAPKFHCLNFFSPAPFLQVVSPGGPIGVQVKGLNLPAFRRSAVQLDSTMCIVELAIPEPPISNESALPAGEVRGEARL